MESKGNMMVRIRAHIKTMDPKVIALIGRGMNIPADKRVEHVEEVICGFLTWKPEEDN
jgi:hypothetical protein